MHTKKEIAEYLEREFINWINSEGKAKSKRDFAKYLDVDDFQLRNWMNGLHKPYNENVVKIGNKLGPEIYNLLGWVKPKC